MESSENIQSTREFRVHRPEPGVSRKERRVLLLRTLAFACVLGGLVLLDWLLEPAISPFSLLGAEFERLPLLAYLTAVARLLGFLLTAVITLCGIAIPLTANNYTPKLISLFMQDKLNWAMLGLLVAANIMVHWTVLTASTGTLPVANVMLTSLLALMCLLLVIPYAFYLFTSLMPQRIVARIEREVCDDLDAASRNPANPCRVRGRVVENLKYISNITLRSVERYDRDTALYSLEALRRIFDCYLERKDAMPDAWFRAYSYEFLSKPVQVIQKIEAERTIFEVELLEECALVLSMVIGKFREGVRMLGAMARHMGASAQLHGDTGALETVWTYFNSFIRAAIASRNSDAIYMLVYQYRLLASQLVELSPDEAVRVAFFLDYYAHQAVRTGIVFVANLIAYDLTSLVTRAYDCDAPCKDRLFELVLGFDRRDGVEGFPGVIKSRIKLAVWMHEHGQAAELDQLCAALGQLTRAQLEAALAEIEGVKTRFFWEITDRRLHVDYVAPERRPHFLAVRARLLGEGG